MHVCSPLLRLVPGFGMHFAKHFSRTVCVGRGGRGAGRSGSPGICGGVEAAHSGMRVSGKSISHFTRTHREELLRVRVRQLRLDLVHHRLRVLAVHPERSVARARRVVANRRSEEWNECDCREELGIGNITNIMTKCPYVFSNPNGRLTDSDRTAASRSRRKAVVPTRTRATRASSVRPHKQSARG